MAQPVAVVEIKVEKDGDDKEAQEQEALDDLLC